MPDVRRAANQYQAAISAFDATPVRAKSWSMALRCIEEVDARDIPAGTLRDLHDALLANTRAVAAKGSSDQVAWSEFIDLVGTLMWIHYQLKELAERPRAGLPRASSRDARRAPSAARPAHRRVQRSKRSR